MKTLKFESKLVADILSGRKYRTWRLFDDKDLQKGDELVLVNKDTNQEFAKATIIDIRQNELDSLNDEDIKEHGYISREEMYEVFKKYYGLKVRPTSVLKIVEFSLK